MRLSKRTRYGIRLVIELAANNDKVMNLTEIAKRQDISMKYLSMIIIPLKRAGIVISSRGAHGGYKLLKPPTQITVADIVNLLEGDLEPVECLAHPEICNRTPLCAAKSLWEKLSATVSEFFHSVTIADLLKEKKIKLRNSNFSYQI
ncbi:MAG: RrF2 family transcriptional regulator [Spirochaetales bacterium]|nr:RrF2 family transcriptional regulator [Spirochaetales bacterium]